MALLYIGAAIIFLWGVAHLVPTRAIVAGFGDISADNRKIIAMESIAEGLTLCFLGVLVLLVALTGADNDTARLVIRASAVMLLLMALLTALTGARSSILPYKICPFVKTAVAVLYFVGAGA